MVIRKAPESDAADFAGLLHTVAGPCCIFPAYVYCFLP